MLAPQKAPTERAWQRVWLTRGLLALSIPGMFCGAAIAVAGGINENHWLFAAGWICAAPCVLFNVLIAFSYTIYGFEYSWLGLRIPENAPTDWQPVRSLGTGINIASQFHGPAAIQFGPGGILVSILVFHPVFIRSSQIVALSNDTWPYVRIDHNSPEIRSPVFVWRSAAHEMERCMPELSLVRR